MSLFAQKILHTVFYGNLFYGLCVAASAAETFALLNRPMIHPEFYGILFCATAIFYNYPYARIGTSHNPRGEWMIRNRKFIGQMQIALFIVLLILLMSQVEQYREAVKNLEIWQCATAGFFILLGTLYYGLNIATARYNLRSIGILKPLVIGTVWAGVTVIYPVLYDAAIHQTSADFSLTAKILFVKTMVFIALLAIMFDIKDYPADSRNRLKTIVVRWGLRRTLFRVIIPSAVVLLVGLTLMALYRDLNPMRFALLAFPILMLIPTGYSLTRRRTLLFYLVAIDGLILVKAVFGILASGF